MEGEFVVNRSGLGQELELLHTQYYNSYMAHVIIHE